MKRTDRQPLVASDSIPYIPCHGIIVAGGTGSRFGSGKPKQFYLLHEKPVLYWSIHTFSKIKSLKSLVIVSHAEWITEVHKILCTFKNVDFPISIVEGGEFRQDSSRNGVMAVKSKSEEIILIHDAARPLATCDLIHRVLQGARSVGAAIPVVAISDSLVFHEHGIVADYPDRTSFSVVQTPQGFRSDRIREAYEIALHDGEINAPDDGSLILRIGYPVAVVPGDQRNIKLTHIGDIPILEKYFSEIPSESIPSL
jgi:2-C-methyl-D-erythritol 4-phosphate cytidylyltransferase